MDKSVKKRIVGGPRKYAPDAKRTTLTFRVHENMRESLVAACAESARSLSEEVERRLEQSFDNAPTRDLLLEVLYQLQQVMKANKGKAVDFDLWMELTDSVAAAEREVGKTKFLDEDYMAYLRKGSDAVFKYTQRFDHKESAVDESAAENTPQGNSPQDPPEPELVAGDASGRLRRKARPRVKGSAASG